MKLLQYTPFMFGIIHSLRESLKFLSIHKEIYSHVGSCWIRFN